MEQPVNNRLSNNHFFIVRSYDEEIYSRSLQVTVRAADKYNMEHEYQNMGVEERLRHHEDLSSEGYAWCPECGETLVWDLPTRSALSNDSGRVPVVTGDCPPLTKDQLLLTVPLP